jgi:hypothetical protein
MNVNEFIITLGILLASNILAPDCGDDTVAYDSTYIGYTLTFIQYIVAMYILYMIWTNYKEDIKALPKKAKNGATLAKGLFHKHVLKRKSDDDSDLVSSRGGIDNDKGACKP